MPSVWPASSRHETPSTERTVPAIVSKWVRRSSTSSSGAVAAVIVRACRSQLARRSEPVACSQLARQARVERVAQAVAEQVDREHGDGEQEAGVQDDVERDGDEVAA